MKGTLYIMEDGVTTNTQAVAARYCVNYHKVRWDESVQEHEGIMEALRRRDGAELSKRLKEHNARTGVAVLARLRGAG